MTQPAPETIRTPKTRIACDGTGDGLADAALGHPRVWLEIDPDQGFADCGYCDPALHPDRRRRRSRLSAPKPKRRVYQSRASSIHVPLA